MYGNFNFNKNVIKFKFLGFFFNLSFHEIDNFKQNIKKKMCESRLLLIIKIPLTKISEINFINIFCIAQPRHNSRYKFPFLALHCDVTKSSNFNMH